MAPSPTDQCIVLPLRADDRQPYSGTGLALHFLMGNVLVLHTGLKEMWFGWRVKKLFSSRQALQRYCRDANHKLDLVQVSREQDVRLWLYGRFSETAVALCGFDRDRPETFGSPATLPIRGDDGLVDFRTRFIDWLASAGRPLPEKQIQPALWPEMIDNTGLDAVGRALEAFYLYSAFGEGSELNVAPFEKAVAAAPESFMAHDLHGWALYRRQDHTGAKIAFLRSLRVNPAGAGAMSGLMWCGVYNADLEEAMFWSGRKADTCGRDVKAAREAARRRYEKVNRQ